MPSLRADSSDESVAQIFHNIFIILTSAPLNRSRNVCQIHINANYNLNDFPCQIRTFAFFANKIANFMMAQSNALLISNDLHSELY